MTKNIVLISAFCILAFSSLGQKFKKNLDRQLTKEDANNLYQSDEISIIDIAQSLELLGAHIYKFDIGDFDTTYNLIVTVDEFTNGKKIKSDTIYNDNNTYIYFAKGETEYFQDFINQIKIITKQDTNKFTVHLRTYGTDLRKAFPYSITAKDQFYSWRSYIETKWKLDTKIPLLIFASSWKDKQYDFQRFCGVAHLKESDQQTNELLTSSPKYYLISYKIFQQKK